MKRCPECRRDYYDDSLLYCLDDGSALLEGPASMDEPATARFGAQSVDAALNRHYTSDQTAILPNASSQAVVPAHAAHKPLKTLIALSLAVLLLAGGFWGYRYLGTRSKQIESIAVLPFENVSGDQNIEYLSDGIPESLINSLTQLEQLQVTARSTAFRYKGKDVDAKTVGKELNVQTVLTGRVRQIGDQLDIQVDLVDAATGAQLWGNEYERKASDIVSIKQAIAREITERMRVKLSGEQQQRLARREAGNGESYQAYLRGRYYWNQRSPEGLRKAVEEFQSAIEHDPNYALAYVGLADCYSVMEQYAGLSTTEALPKGQAAVGRALQIDDSLAEAHTSLGSVLQAQWRWAESESEFKHAIALDPRYPTGHHWLATAYLPHHRYAEALQAVRRAYELDPLSPIIGAAVATMLLLNGDVDASAAQCKGVIELDPNFAFAHNRLAWCYLKQNRYDEATAEFQKSVELTQRSAYFLSDLGYATAVSGHRGEAQQIVAELQELHRLRRASGMHVAAVYAGLNDKDQAFVWLEKDLQLGTGRDLPAVTYRNSFDDMRSDPRYAELVKAMGLTPQIDP